MLWVPFAEPPCRPETLKPCSRALGGKWVAERNMLVLSDRLGTNWLVLTGSAGSINSVVTNPVRFERKHSRNLCRSNETRLSTACVALLVVEQPFLAPQTAAVSAERPIGANDSMARNDDANHVRAIGATDCTARILIAQALCHPRI